MIFDMHFNEVDKLLLFVPRGVATANDLKPYLNQFKLAQAARKKYRLILRNTMNGRSLEKRQIIIRDSEAALADHSDDPADVRLEIYQCGQTMDARSIMIFDQLWNRNDQQEYPVATVHSIGETVENYPILVFNLI